MKSRSVPQITGKSVGHGTGPVVRYKHMYRAWKVSCTNAFTTHSSLFYRVTTHCKLKDRYETRRLDVVLVILGNCLRKVTPFSLLKLMPELVEFSHWTCLRFLTITGGEPADSGISRYWNYFLTRVRRTLVGRMNLH